MDKTYVPSIGTVSHGTLRNADLLPAFANELRQLEPTSSLVAEADAVALLASLGWQYSIWDMEETGDLVSALQDKLAELAPTGLTFGNTEGDGSDFGWWPIPDGE